MVDEHNRRSSDEDKEVQIPKSTLVVGGAFWAVLFAMMAWLLSGVVDMKQAIVRIDGKLDAQNGLIRWNAQRLDQVETRQSVTERLSDGLRYDVDTLRGKR